MHLDEMLAIFLLHLFGEERFPGVSIAETVFWRTMRSPDGKTAEEYEASGTLLVGVGGSRLDEHAVDGRPAKDGECAATLVAKELGIASDRRLRGLLGYALRSDTQTGVGAYEFPALVKSMHALLQDDPRRVLAWGIEALTALLHDQDEFWKARDLLQDTELIELGLPRGESCTMVAVCSDSGHILRAAMSEEGASAALIVQKNSQGNIQIYSNKRYRLDLSSVVAHLRCAEMCADGKEPQADFLSPSCDGTYPGDDRWYYFQRGEMILNGSLTRPEVLPTRLPLERILEIVKGTIRVKPSKSRR